MNTPPEILPKLKGLPESELTGVYFQNPNISSAFEKVPAEELDSWTVMFEKMMENPSPALALALQLETYEKSLPWQLTSGLTRNALSGLQTLMNGQV